MSAKDEKREQIEAAVRSCYSTWGTSYYRDYYGPGAPYPPVHVDLLRRLLLESGAKTARDAGCGPAGWRSWRHATSSSAFSRSIARATNSSATSWYMPTIFWFARAKRDRNSLRLSRRCRVSFAWTCRQFAVERQANPATMRWY